MQSYPDEPMVNGQAAIVTGAGQGIGRGIALKLARDGYQVVLGDMRLPQVTVVADEIRAAGGIAVILNMDVTKPADRQRAIEIALRDCGRLDVLVNNAAIQIASAPLNVTEDHWDSMMNVNAKSVWFMSQLAMQHFVAQKSGRVISIASIAGKMASTLNHPIYNVAKAGVIAMTKTFAHAGAPHGVRVNCVCPGVIDTAMQDQLDAEFSLISGRAPEQLRSERIARIPMGMMGRPEEVADVVAFLASPAARYMTGQAINVSGGMLMY